MTSEKELTPEQQEKLKLFKKKQGELTSALGVI